MKAPIKPKAPHKPLPPEKTLKYPKSISIDGRMSLASILKDLPQGIPLEDVVIGIEDYGDCCSPYYLAKVEYHTVGPNPYYEAEMKRYEKKLEKYNRSLQDYQPKYEIFLKEQKVYEEWYDREIRFKREQERKTEILSLEKKLAKLKKESK